MYLIFLDSSVVEHSAVNRRVVGSNPTRGAKTCKYCTYRFFCIIGNCISYYTKPLPQVVKNLGRIFKVNATPWKISKCNRESGFKRPFFLLFLAILEENDDIYHKKEYTKKT